MTVCAFRESHNYSAWLTVGWVFNSCPSPTLMLSAAVLYLSMLEC